MYVLIYEPGNWAYVKAETDSKNQYAMVFPTFDDAHEAMSNDFHRHVEEHGIEVEDGECGISEFDAYDSPVGEWAEWHIYKVTQAF